MRDHRHGALHLQSHLDTAQYSSLARAQELWNEWEIQCLVMASFSLQVFLLSASPFRKRRRSSVLSGSLWVAYLMADYIATYILGRLTFLVALAAGGDPRRHQLALFWAPFLLLHLGGQETMTAFSMEDNALWKRRLLDLASQVAMAVYVVGKQWRGGDRLLVAPMVLMFIVGAVKYGERIWALKAAAARIPGRKSSHRFFDFRGLIPVSVSVIMTNYYKRPVSNIYSDRWLEDENEEEVFNECILEAASLDFRASLDFFMDVAPSSSVVRAHDLRKYYDEIRNVLMELQSSKNRDVVFKLAEVHASLIYDYLYTKFGTVRFQSLLGRRPTVGALIQWLGSLGLSCAALASFATAMAAGRRRDYNGSDVTISYILLVGAIVMEICSIFIALVSSYWAGPRVAKHLHPEIRCRVEWSGKMAQYSLVDAWLQDKDAVSTRASWLQWAMHRIRRRDLTTHVVVSSKVKNLLLSKLLEIATSEDRLQELDFTGRFQGRWAQWVANSKGTGSAGAASSPAHEALSASGIHWLDFVSSAIIWHLVTHVCILADGSSELTSPSKELSNYIMYLIAKDSVLVDSDGYIVMDISRLEAYLYHFLDHLQQGQDFISKLRADNHPYGSDAIAMTYSALGVGTESHRLVSRALHVCVELLKIPKAVDRWKLIAEVWMEMLCYMALNCGVGFHAKYLTTGGEFITQIKMLLFVIRQPLLAKVQFPDNIIYNNMIDNAGIQRIRPSPTV